MPIHIEEMTSEVVVMDADLPLTPAQLDKLVRLVLRRLEEKERATRQTREATQPRRELAPSPPIEE
jgi:hypothetical protein